MTKKISDYEERIVLFLDILGFTEIVKDSAQCDEQFKKIQTCIRVIRKTFNITQITRERTITQFSDSLIVTTQVCSLNFGNPSRIGFSKKYSRRLRAPQLVMKMLPVWIFLCA
jgi:hypothetical protein